MTVLEHYQKAFKKLKRAPQFGGAPHKPILLLAVLEGVARDEIKSNAIVITPELVLCFKEFWSKLVVTPHQMNFALPFFHLQSEGFWKLICKPGHSLALTTSNSIKSLRSLHESILWAELDVRLFDLMRDPRSNMQLREVLLEKYFPMSNDVAIDYEPLRQLEEAILGENQHTYSTQIDELMQRLPPEQAEEELFVRGSLFKREVPKQYNYTCAISRMRIVTNTSVQMVDACHIVPFAISKDDTIRNGISLSPTLHRAFDRGLIAISNDYTVLVSQHVYEDSGSSHLLVHRDKPILQPTHSGYLPAIENISWHRKEVFLG